MARTLIALSLALAASAQTAMAQEAPSGTVIVKGTHQAGAAHDVTAAKSKVMSRHRGSSCNFMSAPNNAEDDVTLAYLSDFGLDDSISNDAERFSDLAPDGDASSPAVPSAPASGEVAADAKASPSSGCGPGDRRFAAGRSAIERKDRTLALGFEAFDNKDYERALSLFSTAWSKVGYEEAALMLARMHMAGLGTAKDADKAVQWLREVADGRFDPLRDRMRFNPKQPHAMNERVEATMMLARIHERGLSVARDPAQARKWYAKAVDAGFVPALDILGQGFLTGRLGEKNAGKAIGYFRDAAEAGYSPSAYKLGKLYYNGDAGTPRDLKLAGAWFEAAAKRGHPGALFAAGRMIDLGEGAQADPKKAVVYYKEAAVKGDADAEFALGTYFYNGEIVEKNLVTARKLFDAAARQGQADGMFNLAAMELNGEGGAKDLVMAYVWLRLAKQAGHQGADQALKAVAPQLNKAEQSKADAILQPQRKS
jgi:TPR repeat protein